MQLQLHFHDFSNTLGNILFSITFPGPGISILNIHDFSRFLMTVRTLTLQWGDSEAFQMRRINLLHFKRKTCSFHENKAIETFTQLY